MNEPTESFRRYALGHSGYEGGNLKASIYICGIEYGFEDEDDKTIREWMEKRLKEDWTSPRFRRKDWAESRDEKIHPFWQWACKFLAVLRGHSLDEYLDSRKLQTEVLGRYLTLNGDVFQLNLYPVASHKVSGKAHFERIADLTGFNKASDYQQWCRLHRFPKLLDLVRSQQPPPKLLICTGSGWERRGDYVKAFVSGHELQQIQPANLESWFAWINDNQTLVAIVPFFGIGHMRHERLADICMQLSRELQERFGMQWMSTN